MRRIYEEYEMESTANFYEEIPSDAEIDALLYGEQDKAMANAYRRNCERLSYTATARDCYY